MPQKKPAKRPILTVRDGFASLQPALRAGTLTKKQNWDFLKLFQFSSTNKVTTAFLNLGLSEPQRSYKHGSYKKRKV